MTQLAVITLTTAELRAIREAVAHRLAGEIDCSAGSLQALASARDKLVAATPRRRRVYLDLSPAEAECLSLAAGNWFSDPETVAEWFKGAQEKVAWRAWGALRRAIQRASA